MSMPLKAIRRQWARPRRSLERGVQLIRDAGDPPPAQPRDVWDWTRRKYRIRAFLLLLVNVALFVGLGCFAFWLRTGQYSPFSGPRRYWDMWWSVFDPTGPQQVTLIDYLLYPIPVDQVPLMAVIVGLVLASMTAVPILVSMLYRFPFALLFTAIIGFVAMLPWLAIMVTLSCWLARWRRVQFSFRFATALISLLPLVSYYALATRGVSGSAHLTPLEMGKLYVPWVLALSGACLVMAIVLTIARLVNYRPGAIAPLMTVMFALPVILFEFKVGRDELYYRLLQHDFGPSSRTHFRSQVPAAELIERAARRRLPESEEQNPVALQATMEQVQIALQMRLASGVERSDEITCLINEDFAREQYEVVQACERFRRAFPKSRYVPNALYLQGQALDTHIEQALALFQGMLVLRYYQDFPNPASRRSWQELRERFPNSPLATIARLRLAMLKGRAGQIDEAVALLDEQLACYRREPSATSRPGSWAAVLAKRPATSGIEVDQESAVLEGRKLRLLLAENRDPQQNDFALRRLLSLDPHHGMYRRNLEQLLDVIPERFPLTRLRDNLQVLLAAAQASRSVRIERLRAVIAQLTPQRDSDALPRARLELGVVYQEDSRNEEARVLFEEIMQKHPDTPWASDASRRLAAMGAAARTST